MWRCFVVLYSARFQTSETTSNVWPLAFQFHSHLVCLSSFLCFSSQLFAARSKEHEKYGGDPDQPHKLHIVTRVRSVIRRPYWEKDMVKNLGLEKVSVCMSRPTNFAIFNNLLGGGISNPF